MNFTSFFIAYRYFRSKRKARFINIISGLSMLGIAVGTAALIIVLSVFNGLEVMIEGLYSHYNPELLIKPAKGKTFEIDEAMRQRISQTKGVILMSEIIEDNAVARYQERQMVVKVKGVSDNYARQSNMQRTIVDGNFLLQTNTAVLGIGVQYTLSINLKNHNNILELWYPKRTQKIILNSTDPAKYFQKASVVPAGIFSLEQHFDENLVFVPIAFAEKLFDYAQKRTAIEIKLQPQSNTEEVKKALMEVLGNSFEVLSRAEQQASLLRAIQVEKLFVYLTLSFILAIASFNIFFSLMMLVIAKEKDISILKSMGANQPFLRTIFLTEGTIIAFTGALVGILAGTSIVLLQQEYGFVKLGTTSTVIDAYPVELRLIDFVFTFFTIVAITLLSSIVPANKAANVQFMNH
ncbi:MAG: ABC transporter permease [Cytophagales bacterium]|nr:MAG: ABC transporter permease [Cytophagales bacterium]